MANQTLHKVNLQLMLLIALAVLLKNFKSITLLVNYI